MTNDGGAMLIVGHGTRSERGVAEFGSFIQRLQKRAEMPYPAAAGGFIELSDPAGTSNTTGWPLATIFANSTAVGSGVLEMKEVLKSW